MLLVYVLLAIVSSPGHQSSMLLQRFLRTEFDICTKMDTLTIGVGSEQPMANPGESFNVTDVVEDDSWPSQRLGSYGRSDSLWFVYYEQGGFGHSWQIVLFTVEGENATTLAAYWVVSASMMDIRQLKDWIRDSRVVTMIQFRKPMKGQRVLVVQSNEAYQVHIRRLSD